MFSDNVDSVSDKKISPHSGAPSFRSAAGLRNDAVFAEEFASPRGRMQENNIAELMSNSAACLEGTELFGFLCYIAGLSKRNVAVVSPHFFAAHAHDMQTEKDSIRSSNFFFGDDEACEVVFIPAFINSGQNFEHAIGHWVRRMHMSKGISSRIRTIFLGYPEKIPKNSLIFEKKRN